MLLRHTQTKLLYRLFDRGDGSYYLSANDGRVPSGQILNGPLDRILTDYPLEVVKE